MGPRRARVAAATVAVLGLSACSGPAADRPPLELRPVSASGSWNLAGSSDTTAARPMPVESGWGPSDAEIARATSLVAGLTLRERAGQVIVASYSGTGAPAEMVDRLHLGGVLPFSGNVTSAAQIAGVNRTIQRSAARAGRRWTVLIGVDQEGGQVARVSAGATSFPTFMSTGAAGDPDLTRQVYAASGGELVGLGFTVDFAPDADVTSGPSDPAIGARSAGSSAERVAAQVLAASKGFAAAGVVPVIKHFPGHGSVTTDSHLGLPVQRRSRAALDDVDLVPFRRAVAAGASAVMVGHLDVRAIDPRMPSSLSHAVVTGLLRDRIGFHGVAFTDSLQMKAVTDRFGGAASAVRALNAGQDVLLMPPDPRAARDGIVAAVRDGRLDQARLDQAAIRMVALLLHQRGETHRSRPAGSSGAVSARLSAAAITSVSGACSGRLVGGSVRVTGPSSAVTRFRSAAATAGLRIAPPPSKPAKPTKTTKSKKKQQPKPPVPPTTVRLVGYPSPSTSGDVVVAMDTPYVLGRSSARVAKLATFGETPGAMSALVSVLLGRTTAPGHLPVPVAGVTRTGC
ncbi:MAG: glycoside hydrolase family 3 N-terminal domain-containing protein [Nocardioidaceae bacterium]